jgi:hypothetical protein
MTMTMRVASVMALLAGLMALPDAALLVAAEQIQLAAPAELQELAGQTVPGERDLQWRYAEVMIEWGFTKGTEKRVFDGSLQCTQTGVAGKAKPIPGDGQTIMTAERAWKSPSSPQGRRGVLMPVLYTPSVRGPSRTILTVRTSSGSFSFQPVDLENGPILVNEYGFFVRAMTQPQPPQPLPMSEKDAHASVLADLLKSKMNAGEGSAERPGWGSAQTPCVYANSAKEPASLLGGLIKLPPRSVAVHPGPDRDVAVGWRSPMAGKVSVTAKVIHAHPTGGNGVEWSIVHHAKASRSVLCKGAIDRGGSAAIPAPPDVGKLATIPVEQGEVLSLVINNRGDHSCDSTTVELTMTEVASKTRVWNLASDVVDDIQAANPHADSLGNTDVWYFYAPRSPGPSFGWRPPVVAIESKATSAAEYLAERAARQPKTLRQQVRERPEQTWEGAMRAVHGDRPFPPFPKPPYEPKMSVEVPDPNLTALWRIGAWQIIKQCPRIHREDVPKVGKSGDVSADCRRIADLADLNGVYVVRDNPFPPLGCETDRILWALDHLGMHHVARDGMSIWLENQQPDGALSLNSGMEHAHKVGALQLLWVMAEHYRLTGDKQWLQKELPRLKSAVDWIINRRRTTMKEKLTAEEQAAIKAGKWSPYGLQPRIQMGDGDPAGANYFYMADAFAYRSVKLLAEVIGDVDAKLAADLAAEAEAYRKDILKVVDESLVLSPVLRTRDGCSRFFLPQGFQHLGPCAHALPESVNIFSHCGPYSADIVGTSASIEAWLQSGLLSIDDPRIDGHYEILEDLFLRDHPWMCKRKHDYDSEKDWFANGGWGYQSGWERVPDFYLAKDDVPNFLRSWLNRCAVDMNLSNWTFNEHTTFAANDKSHGNSVFLSNFRRMLVMEIGDTLWLGRATPRAWLEQGKRITVKNSPTYFGTVAYEIVSDTDNGKIAAIVEMPPRKAPKEVFLRFRHPKSSPIKSVTINGKPWNHFDKDKEVIALKGLTGTISVTTQY